MTRRDHWRGLDRLRTSRLGTAIHITAVSNPFLTSPWMAFISLVVLPLLQVVLLVSVLASVGVHEIRDAAYASLLVAFGLGVLLGTVEQVIYDRQIGIAQEIVGHGLANPAYWLGKLLVPMVLGIVPAVLSAVVVYLVSGGGDVGLLWRVLALIPLAALSGGLVGLTAAIGAFAAPDPYLIQNIASAVLMVTAGVVLPLALYPTWLAAIARFLPFTAAVEAIRTTGPIWPLVLQEIAVALGWLTIGLLTGRHVLSAVRSGKRSNEIW